jgi:hypothetical protein
MDSQGKGLSAMNGKSQTTGPYAEYLRRNLIVAGAIGARAGCDAALDRLRGQKGAPKWLVAQLESIRVRVVPTIDELTAWRAIAADAPIYENGVKVR